MITFTGAVVWFGGTVLAGLGFLLGKAFSQSERILDQKRLAYEEFLRLCPAPNEAQFGEEMDVKQMQRSIGILTLYGSEEALKFASKLFRGFRSSAGNPYRC
ncbi:MULTISPECIES: hypothetical protein [Pseudosulfitobacter]|uniref:hypothetical protein n=1 Tax=Pseudosulfitobacter pseudonitzschiae TaxID=1402135 RepID=UPI001160F6F1|nr:hypothetical protein [Pseudosulfitobacter pseudonitzschiae]QKS07516.1 hypothetical protein HT745_02985 [Pseudosulfitobacter pseudonitzschiae]